MGQEKGLKKNPAINHYLPNFMKYIVFQLALNNKTQEAMMT